MTPAAGHHTLAGVDALTLVAALVPRETDDAAVLARLPPFLIADLEAPLPDLVERDGKDAAWFCSR